MQGARQRIEYGCRRTSRSLLLVVLLTALTACASPPDRRFDAGRDSESDLYGWVDKELGPYLTTQLSQHPRFKGEPLLVVGMNGADVRPDSDALTQSIRSRIMDQLLSEPGINLVWRPAMRPWQHHRVESQRECNDSSQANYYIGIEITTTPERETRVSVRALDLLDQSWVSGFGKTWQGALTEAQQLAWRQNRVDEYLRGLRVLPFIESETDLLAAYLAENLACLLHRQGTDRPLVYLDNRDTTPKVLAKVTAGVGHYLVRQQAIRITGEQSKADLILSANLNLVDRNLHQLWLSVKPTNRAQPLAGIDTDGYILLPDPVKTTGRQTPDHRDTIRKPSHSTPNGTVISGLRIVRHSDPEHCITGDPWAHDESLVPSDGVIQSGDCKGLEFDLYQTARVYVLNQRVDGKLVRLLPNSCRPRRTTLSMSPAGTTVWVPHRPGIKTLGGAPIGYPAIESFYVIAIKQSTPTRAFDAHLKKLPETCGDHYLVETETLEIDHWLARLDTLVSRLGNGVDWRGLRVRHGQ